MFSTSHYIFVPGNLAYANGVDDWFYRVFFGYTPLHCAEKNALRLLTKAGAK